ncbi:MAG: low molecular weight protein-tyrosine-phosphatase [Pseudomonadales bacterium]
MSIGVMFVCLGNICRSPMAEGVFRQLVEHSNLQQSIHVDSSGTAAFNVGKSPDPRAIAAAQRKGFDISQQIARQIDDADYLNHRYIIGMDRNNLSNVIAWAPKGYDGEMKLLMDYTPRNTHAQVADPYYAEAGAFDLTLLEIEKGAGDLLSYICEKESLIPD